MELSCRICELVNSNFNFKNIFDDQNFQIIEKLKACANILLEKEDQLPQFVCESCENDLNLAFTFRVKCEETDAKLRKKLQSLKDPLKEEDILNDTKIIECKKEHDKNIKHVNIGNEPKSLIEIEFISDSVEIKNENDFELIKTLKPKEEISNEKSTHLSNIYKCETCHVIFEKRNNYILHIRSHGKQRFQCKNCNHWCASKTKLKIHMDEVHNRNGGSVCELCGKKFSNPRNLQRHIVDCHEQRKPYKCLSCNQSFARSYILNQHNSTVHSNVRNWQCDECQKTFKLEAQLKLHKKQKHLPEGERLVRKKKLYKKVVCPECGKLCQSNAALIDHLRWHTGEKPYQCTVCGKSFAMKNALYRHDMVHKGLKPYKCDICHITFRQTNHLKIHKLTHTGEKPHQCDICERAFATKGNLTVHQKLHLYKNFTEKVKKN